MVNRWFGVGQFLSGAMGQLYPGGDKYLKEWQIQDNHSSIKGCEYQVISK